MTRRRGARSLATIATSGGSSASPRILATTRGSSAGTRIRASTCTTTAGPAGALYVVEGELLETSGRLGAEGGLREERLTAGTALAFGRGHVHWVVNPTPQVATSIHVYSPPLTTMDFYETESDSTFRRLRTEVADPRPDHRHG